MSDLSEFGMREPEDDGLVLLVDNFGITHTHPDEPVDADSPQEIFMVFHGDVADDSGVVAKDVQYSVSLPLEEARRLVSFITEELVRAMNCVENER